jgi:hypothetical protein
MITVDKRLVCKYVDIPRPRRLNVLDKTLNWLEKEDGPGARLAAWIILGFTALYLTGQVVRCLVS